MRRPIVTGAVVLAGLATAAVSGIASAADRPAADRPAVPSAAATAAARCDVAGSSDIRADGTATVSARATGCAGTVVITLEVGATTRVFRDGGPHSLTARGDATSYEVRIDGRVVSSGQDG